MCTEYEVFSTEVLPLGTDPMFFGVRKLTTRTRRNNKTNKNNQKIVSR